jgi:predicted DNA-binding antitoxin AbrB/MazE fold protein
MGVMNLEVEATYENGVLKLDQPLPLQEKQRVKVTIRAASSRVGQGRGLVQWTGSLEDLDYLISSPDNDQWEREPS